MMWTPVVLFFYVFHWLDPWVVWSSSVWAHLQGFASSTVSLYKPDIAKAVKDFWTCQQLCHHRKPEERPTGPNNTTVTTTTSGSFRFSLFNIGSSGGFSRDSFRHSVPRRFNPLRKSGDDGGDSNVRNSATSYLFGNRTDEVPTRGDTNDMNRSNNIESSVLANHETSVAAADNDDSYNDFLQQNETTYEFLDEKMDSLGEDDDESEELADGTFKPKLDLVNENENEDESHSPISNRDLVIEETNESESP